MEKKEIIFKEGDKVFVVDNLVTISGEVVSISKPKDYYGTERAFIKFSNNTENPVRAFLMGAIFATQEEAQRELYKQLDSVKTSSQVAVINGIYEKAKEICTSLENNFPTLISKGKNV